MSESSLDLIVVEAEHVTEVAADHVELWIDVRGTSFFTGSAALKRAKEVREIVEAVTALGVAEEDVMLHGAVAITKTGTLATSSEANYTLCIVCRDLDQLADIMNAATTPKHTRASRLEWRFPRDESLVLTWLEAAVSKAHGRATTCAKTANARLGQLHRLDHDVTLPENERQHLSSTDLPGRRKRSEFKAGLRDELGVDVVHRSRATVKVRASFHVLPVDCGQEPIP